MRNTNVCATIHRLDGETLTARHDNAVELTNEQFEADAKAIVGFLRRAIPAITLQHVRTRLNEMKNL